jgi:hypothetical protein
MENHHFQWVNPIILWPFSIAMLNYQRVISTVGWFPDFTNNFLWDFQQFKKNHQAQCVEIINQIINSG